MSLLCQQEFGKGSSERLVVVLVKPLKERKGCFQKMEEFNNECSKIIQGILALTLR